MATSGTTSFSLDVIELVEEAYERAGLELRGGYDLRSARRSMDLLFREWENRGINLWTVEERTQALSTGVQTYTLGADIVDLLEHMIRLPITGGTTSQTDYIVSRISVSTWATRTSKLQRSRPTEIYIDRQRDAPQITLWPSPDRDDYTLVYWVMRRMEDAGTYTNTGDFPFRFYEAMCAGLAYRIAMKKREVADRLPMLKAEYEAQYALAAEQDREKADSRFVPRRTYNR
jgi:hypothetical protein